MSGNEREEEPICDMENCTKPVKYICIVEDGHNVCADHLPPAGQGTEYFWEVNGCPCWGCQLENNDDILQYDESYG